jgi:ethanolamine ammonia-lyase small subunit
MMSRNKDFVRLILIAWRVRAGYHVGALLEAEMIIHLIGERRATWDRDQYAFGILNLWSGRQGAITLGSRSAAGFDHSWTTAVCGIHRRGKSPERAVEEIARLVERNVYGSVFGRRSSK